MSITSSFTILIFLCRSFFVNLKSPFLEFAYIRLKILSLYGQILHLYFSSIFYSLVLPSTPSFGHLSSFLEGDRMRLRSSTSPSGSMASCLYGVYAILKQHFTLQLVNRKGLTPFRLLFVALIWLPPYFFVSVKIYFNNVSFQIIIIGTFIKKASSLKLC